MRKNEVENVEDLEVYYSQARKIKFKDYPKIRNVKQVKRLLFEESPTTTYSRGGYHSESGRYRSFDDYFILCKNYFPNKTIKYFAEVLIKDEEFKKSKSLPRIQVRYCPNIRKTNSGGLYRFIYSNSTINENPNQKLQLGFKDKYSLNEIIAKNK